MSSTYLLAPSARGVAADRPPKLHTRAHQPTRLARHADPDRVGEDDLVGAGGDEASGKLEDVRRVDGALERATERGADRDGGPHAVPVRALDDPPGRLQGLLERGVRVPAVERLRRGEGEVHLVETGGEQSLVPALVDDETRVDDARLALDPLDHLLGVRHLRHAHRVDEADRLDPPYAGG